MKGELLDDRYLVLDELDHSGQATVLEAVDTRHDRRVALKISRSASGDEKDALLGEIRVLLGLTPHAGLPIVRDDFSMGDRSVVVMDWIDGVDLAQLLVAQGDPGLIRSVVVDYISQAAAALDHLHTHVPPVVHGDVKPANLILTPTGSIVLVDFGIARVGGVGAAIGSRGFMAPEVASGEPVTIAADVYGLAATAVTLLTGHVPGPGGLALDELDPDEIGPMARVLRRALSTDPAKRPPSAGDLAERLRAGHRALPTGVLTFLATEIVGTGELWDDDPVAMEQISARLDDLVAQIVETNGGRLVSTTADGDCTLSVFSQPPGAAQAAVTLHAEIASERWPNGVVLKLRAGLDSGMAERRDGSYSGPVLSRVRRLRDRAPEGRTLLSQATADLVRTHLPVGTWLVDLDEPAKGRDAPTGPIHGLVTEDDPDRFAVEPAHVPHTPTVLSEVDVLHLAVQELRTASQLEAYAVALAAQERQSGRPEPAAELEATSAVLRERMAELERQIADGST